MRRALGAIAVLAAAVMVAPPPALANPNDISIRGLGRPQSNSLDDPAVRRYRFLANELAISLAPRVLAPAETLGMNGFEFSLVSTHTPINWDSDYWKGQPGSPIFEGVARGRNQPKVFWSASAHLRKGLPMSMEVGISGSYLAYSEMFALGADFKITWHESFFRWVPAFATRVAFGRLFGNSDLDIITGEADGVVSLPFGIAGMAQLTPFAGYGMLFIHINSQVIDETPYLVTDGANDQRGGPDGSLYNFPTIEWNENRHHRIFAGLRFIVAFLEVIYEFDYVLVDGPANIQSHSLKFGFDT